MLTPAPRLKGLFILDDASVDLIYGPEDRREIEHCVEILAPPLNRDAIRKNLSLLADVDVLFSGWMAPVMDEEFLAAAPRLKAVFYGAGTIRYFATDAFWARNIVVTSAHAANAVPVAEYTLGTILLSLKHFWRFAAHAKSGGAWGDHTRLLPGCFRTTVGLVSFGVIARKVNTLLKSFDVHRLVYCPFLTAAEAREHGVELCSLEEIFRRSEVVSLHSPNLPATKGLITGPHFAAMKPGATFINTARGPIVRETEMLEVLRRRSDLTAILDVTDPEPPPADSPLFAQPNVVVTPHIAGSMGPEIGRMGHSMVEELHRYLAGEPMQWQITREQVLKMA